MSTDHPGGRFPMRVVIVEDDNVARLQLKRLLTRFAPSAIFEARNGEEGLAVIFRELPHVVFCDLSMPVMDGVAMIEALRAHPQFTTLPIIAISASNDKETVLHLIKMGIVDYLIKPIPFQATYHRLQKVLSTLLPAMRNAPPIDPGPPEAVEPVAGDSP